MWKKCTSRASDKFIKTWMLSIFYPISKLNIPHGVYPTIFLSNSGLGPEYILLLKGSVGQFKFSLSQKSEFNTNFSRNAGLLNPLAQATKQNYQGLQKIQGLKLYLTMSTEMSKNTNNTWNKGTKDLSANLLPYKKHFFFDLKKKKIKDLYFLTRFQVTGYLWPSPQNTNYLFPYISEDKNIVSSLEFKDDLNLEFGFLYKNLQNKTYKQKLREQREKKKYLSPLLKNLTKLMIGVSRGYTMQLSLKGVGFSCKILNLENEKDNFTGVRPINNLSKLSLDLFSHAIILTWSKIFFPYKSKKIKNLTQKIILNLGFSHNILFAILTKNVRVELLTVDQQPSCALGTRISIFGISLNQVNQIAANIYNCKKPEPYKGKGIRYKNEKLFIKVAKANKKV